MGDLARYSKNGGPYQIEIFTKEDRLIIKDLLIEELWLCSGQSNMEYSADDRIIDARDAMPTSQNNQIRFFFVPKATAPYPQDDYLIALICNQCLHQVQNNSYTKTEVLRASVFIK